MSDGGAGGIGQVLALVAQVRVGRILLWLVVTLMGLMAIVTQEIQKGLRSGLVALAFLLALFAIGGSVQARRQRRSSSIPWLLPKVVLAVAGLGLAALLLWLRSRGRKVEVEALPPPPRPEEVDQLARAELEEERAA
jgi:hypothetical protein